jgi:hypothetical protein
MDFLRTRTSELSLGMKPCEQGHSISSSESAVTLKRINAVFLINNSTFECELTTHFTYDRANWFARDRLNLL